MRIQPNAGIPHSFWPLPALLVLSACGASSRPAPAAAPRSDAAPVQTGTHATSVGENAAPASAPSSAFHLVATFDDDEPGLHPTVGRAFVVASSRILDIEGDDLVFDVRKQAGLEHYQREHSIEGAVLAVGGVWPSAMWLGAVESNGRVGRGALYRWGRVAWERKRVAQSDKLVIGFAPWSGGRTLALFREQMSTASAFMIVDGPPAPLPRAARSPDRDCIPNLRAWHLAALPSGEVFTAGDLCPKKDAPSDEGSDRDHAAVERWAAGSQRSVIEELPGAEGVGIVGLVAVAPNEVYAGGNSEVQRGAVVPYLSRFNGAAWAKVSVPGELTAIDAMSGSDDGALWAVGGGMVWRRTREGAWSKIALPLVDGKPIEARQIWARGPDDVWIAASKAVFHTKPPTKAFEMPAAPPGYDANDLTKASPPSASCATPFVMLYTLAENAPTGYDFPATRAALKGHTELAGKATFVEFDRGGRRFLGARVADFKVGASLTKLVRTKVPGATPMMACDNPKVLRELPINLATGGLGE